MSQHFSVYEHSSQAVDEFFVAYIKGWHQNDDLQIADMISLFFNLESNLNLIQKKNRIKIFSLTRN